MPIQIKHLEAQRTYFENKCPPNSKLPNYIGVIVSSINFSIREYAHVTSSPIKPNGTLVLYASCTFEE
jgi:hypothetical protein